MKNKKLLISGIIVSFLGSTISSTLGSAVLKAETVENVDDFANLEEGEIAVVEKNEEKEAEERQKLASSEAFLNRVEQELNLTKSEYQQLLEVKSEAEFKLEEHHEHLLNYQEQKELMEEQYDLTSAEALETLEKIVIKENEIILAEEELKTLEVAFETEKQLLSDYMALMYNENQKLFTINDDGSVNAIKLLLTDGTTGENLQNLYYLDVLEDLDTKIIEDIENTSEKIEISKIFLEKEKENLETLYEDYEEKQEQLRQQKESLDNLIKFTEGQEEIYQDLLDQTVLEQENSIETIQGLTKAFQFLKERYEQEGVNFDPSKYQSIINSKKEFQAIYELQTYAGEFRDGMVWPVKPPDGVRITAYFEDASYVSTFGVAHKAVDIATPQASELYACWDGIVVFVKDNGYGYSSLGIANKDGVVCVYGHVYDFDVIDRGDGKVGRLAVGDRVRAGQVVALSGGAPGTKGAGYMTTGAHLHFEVIENGVHRNPMHYLPLEDLSEKEINRLTTNWQEAARLAKDSVQLLSREELEKLSR